LLGYSIRPGTFRCPPWRPHSWLGMGSKSFSVSLTRHLAPTPVLPLGRRVCRLRPKRRVAIRRSVARVLDLRPHQPPLSSGVMAVQEDRPEEAHVRQFCPELADQSIFRLTGVVGLSNRLQPVVRRTRVTANRRVACFGIGGSHIRKIYESGSSRWPTMPGASFTPGSSF
jgi:hypothetical protein